MKPQPFAGRRLAGLAFGAGVVAGVMGVSVWLNWPSWRIAWVSGLPPRYPINASGDVG